MSLISRAQNHVSLHASVSIRIISSWVSSNRNAAHIKRFHGGSIDGLKLFSTSQNCNARRQAVVNKKRFSSTDARGRHSQESSVSGLSGTYSDDVSSKRMNHNSTNSSTNPSITPIRTSSPFHASERRSPRIDHLYDSSDLSMQIIRLRNQLLPQIYGAPKIEKTEMSFLDFSRRFSHVEELVSSSFDIEQQVRLADGDKIQATSVKRKRRLKMNRHKLKKRRRAQRALRRRLGR